MATAKEAAMLSSMSVKELRRQAALRNVPLTQITTAVEKKDLIALIAQAPTVLDQYDISGGKVHTAESISQMTYREKVERKKKQSKRARSSSSSSSSSRHKKKKKKGKRKRSKSPIAHPLRGKKPAIMIDGPAEQEVLEIEEDDEPPKPEAVGGMIAQAGMAAAAALGFSVEPKQKKTGGVVQTGAAQGLRPSIRAPEPVTGANSFVPNKNKKYEGRICIAYLCTAQCQLGANCPDMHIVDPEEEMRTRARFKGQMCSFGSECTRSYCLYRHPGEKLEEHVAAPEGHSVTMKGTGSGMVLQFM
eukprot:gnl/TRDRNA2_/TRDRNA2_81005_c0_seq1.p1 gnl/TRDRNA2_/TRDRNA2_81005_c0~~gnl/TRDRNA2_/TRDRNA2_81005_c0_seq1.p1  ORF type:complete len:303 (+),score=80.44 gnl/TRDRNA2_/TRDRNA2_81005_c0_seq1:105-1013(+)